MSVAIFNFSNLSVGGGVAVALSVINEINQELCACKNKYFDYFLIIVNPLIGERISCLKLNENVLVETITTRPASLISRRKFCRSMNSIIERHEAKVVFSLFGPSHWNPPKDVIHVMGFAQPWLLPYSALAYSRLSLGKKIEYSLRRLYWAYRFRREADALVCEAEAVALGLEQSVLKEKRKYVVPNTVATFYGDRELWQSVNLPKKRDGVLYFATIAHDYHHKNLDIIGGVGRALKAKGVNAMFITTIDQSRYLEKPKEFREFTINVGPLLPEQAPFVYDFCDGMFLPTLLECFTACYVESMVMKKPIFTSDLPFARSLCSDIAIYVNPMDADLIADSVLAAYSNPDELGDKVARGYEIARCWPSANDRFKSYLKIIQIEEEQVSPITSSSRSGI